jgi:hypothetical protein
MPNNYIKKEYIYPLFRHTHPFVRLFFKLIPVIAINPNYWNTYDTTIVVSSHFKRLPFLHLSMKSSEDGLILRPQNIAV